MAKSDTELVRRFLSATEGQPQEAKARIAGVSQPTISLWERMVGDKLDITVRKGDAKQRMEAYILANAAPGFAEGVRLAIDEARRALDELEKRLTAGVTPADRATGPGEDRREKGKRGAANSRLAVEHRRRTGTEPPAPGE